MSHVRQKAERVGEIAAKAVVMYIPRLPISVFLGNTVA
jgi:hypothetical protein